MAPPALLGSPARQRRGYHRAINNVGLTPSGLKHRILVFAGVVLTCYLLYLKGLSQELGRLEENDLHREQRLPSVTKTPKSETRKVKRDEKDRQRRENKRPTTDLHR